MNKKTKRIGKRLGASMLITGLCATMIASSVPAFAIKPIDDANRLGAGEGGKIYSEFTSNDELKAKTKETNIRLGAESAILLKNGGGIYQKDATTTEDHTGHALPWTDMKNISIFGINSDAYGYGGTGSGSGYLEDGADVYTTYKNAGLNINPKLKELYQKYSGGSLSAVSRYTTPTYEDKELPMDYYTESITSTYKRYSDAAFIVISRLGGEGSDLARNNVGNRYKEATDEDGNVIMENGKPKLVANPDEHYLELSYKEKQLIKHVEDNFDKVVVLFNSGNIIEFGELENDPRIDAIVNIGQTGDYGLDGVLKVLKGEISPSGRTVDIYPADFTVDPTYQNFGNGNQTTEDYSNNYNYTYTTGTGDAAKTSNVATMMEYEEGIYLGYKYYETMYGEIKANKVDLTADATKKVLGSKDLGDTYTDADDWYNKNVIYPFGYGLSYADFSWTFDSLEMDTATLTKDTKFTATVTVTNNSTKYAGKDVVELYMKAPYTPGGIEKAAVRLIGFAKTHTIEAGKSETVTIEFDAYDIASYDYSNANSIAGTGYEIDAGNYEFVAAKNSHDAMTTDKMQTKTFDNLDLPTSQATGAEVDNVFVDSPDAEAKYNHSTISPTMTIMSRKNMIGTFPKAPTADERNLNLNATATNPLVKEGDKYGITKQEIYDKLNYGFIFGRDDDTHEIWNVWGADEKIIPDTWTQAADDKGTVTIRLPELMSYSPYDTETKVVSGNKAINGKTAAQAWELFMNQLTYEEIKLLNSTGFFKTAAVERVGKEEAVDADGPCTIGGQTKDGYSSVAARGGGSGTRYWCSAQNQAATWDTEFCHEIGLLIGEEGMWNGYNGWYAPSMNTHRSPFSGRNFEYYSQDGVHGGLIAGAVISGVSSKGVYPYIKHFALNDQETSRGGILTWADEQTIRENYLRVYQYAVEQGGATAVMTGFNRIGTIACSDNYPLLRQILREEWGFVGTVVTDYMVGNVGQTLNNLEIMTRAGNNIPLGDRGANARGGGVWDPTLRVVGGKAMGGVKVLGYELAKGADGQPEKDENGNPTNRLVVKADKPENYITSGRYVDMQYYYARNLAMELLYTHCRSNAIDNGADFLKNFAAQTIKLPAGVQASKVIETGFGQYDDVTYEVVTSNLPANVSFNANTLTFSGTRNTKLGEKGSITIKVSYDSWANKKVTFPVEIVEPLTFDGKTALAKDTAYTATVTQDYWKVTPGCTPDGTVTGTASVKYTATGLPAGLTITEAGAISGTPTAAGEYTVTLNCAVVTRNYNWWNGRYSNSTANYNTTVTLTVGDLVTVTVDGVAQKVEKGAKMTAPEAPEAPEGMRFVGWYSGDTAFDFDTAINANTTLTAKFEAIPDSVEFRVNEGKIQASFNGGEWVDVANLADLKGDKGETGAAGTAGTNGADAKVEISEDGYWVINGNKTDVKAEASGGCGGAVGLGSGLAAMGVVLAAVVVFAAAKKRKNNG